MHVRGIAACVALAVMLMLPAPAGAYTGEITRATADPTWTTSSFAGKVLVESCLGVPCTWVPLATAQPALPEYGCGGAEPFDSDPNTAIVWSGGVQSAPGAVPFDVSDMPILPGVHGQRLCLMVVELGRQPDPVCVATAPILGINPASCPARKNDKGAVVAERVVTDLQVAPVETATPEPTPEPGLASPTTTTLAPAPLPKSTAAALTRRVLRKEGGRSWLRRTRTSVRCTRETSDVVVCKARWKYKKKSRVRRILVARGADGKVTAAFLKSGV